LALSAGVASAEQAVYPRRGYAPFGYGYAHGYYGNHHRYYGYYPRYRYHRYWYRC